PKKRRSRTDTNPGACFLDNSAISRANDSNAGTSPGAFSDQSSNVSHELASGALSASISNTLSYASVIRRGRISPAPTRERAYALNSSVRTDPRDASRSIHREMNVYLPGLPYD